MTFQEMQRMLSEREHELARLGFTAEMTAAERASRLEYLGDLLATEHKRTTTFAERHNSPEARALRGGK